MVTQNPEDWARGDGGALAPQLPRAIRAGPNPGGNFFEVFCVYLLIWVFIYSTFEVFI